MKKTIYVIIFFICVGIFNINSSASEIKTVSIPVNGMQNITNGKLIDSYSFTIEKNGIVKYSSDNRYLQNEPKKANGILSDVVTGTFNYYYNGLDSKKRPQYSVVLTIVSLSDKTLTGSTLSTKAEGANSWHDNKMPHVGKVGINTRAYCYTMQNPPKNPYCYAKAEITISDGTVYKIAKHKLKLK